MKEVIETLVKIEEKANRIMERTNTQKLELEQEKRQEIEALKAKLEKENEKKISDLKERLNLEMQPETEQVYKRANEQLMKVELSFVEKKDEMADEIVARIIGA